MALAGGQGNTLIGVPSDVPKDSFPVVQESGGRAQQAGEALCICVTVVGQFLIFSYCNLPLFQKPGVIFLCVLPPWFLFSAYSGCLLF